MFLSVFKAIDFFFDKLNIVPLFFFKMKLVLIGGCRNAEDEKRVRDLKDLCGHMSVEDNVEFKVLPPQPRSQVP